MKNTFKNHFILQYQTRDYNFPFLILDKKEWFMFICEYLGSYLYT